MLDIETERTLAQAIVDTVREPILVLDADLRVVAASRSFCLRFKFDRENVEGQLFHALSDGLWDISALSDELNRVSSEGNALEGFEVDLTFPELGRRVLLLNARKVFYDRGGHTTILLAFEDVTDRRLAQQERDSLLREKDFLLEEMQHRVANSLQIIASILLMKARTVTSEETRTHLHEAHKRVIAVAAVQRHLHKAGVQDVDMRPYLTQLCASLAASMVGERTIAINARIDDAMVSSSDAVSIGLVVTELVINALKHAFPKEMEASKVDVVYARDDQGWRLSVSDNGVGPSAQAAPGERRGLGTSIVEALAQQLDGKVGREASGPGYSVSITRKRVASNAKREIPAAALAVVPAIGVWREKTEPRQVSMSW
jgi:two-component sensor histidine kinase